MLCSMCGHQAKQRRITDKLSKGTRDQALCDDCAESISHNKNLTVEDIDDHTHGDTMPDKRGDTI